MSMAGCGTRVAGHPPTLVYVIDYSESTATIRREQLGQMFAELESMADDDNVVIYRMGSETEEVFTGQLGDAGVDGIMETVKSDLVHSDPKRGTDFSRMALTLLAFSQTFSGKEYRLRIMTDGGNDALDAESIQAYHRAANLLTQDKRLASVVFYGVRPPYRRAVRTAFGAAGGRLQLLRKGQVIDQ
jgi:hypothetical protein